MKVFFINYPSKTEMNAHSLELFSMGYSGGIRVSLVAQMIKNLPAMQETPGLIPGLGRSPGEGNGNPLQYSRLENSMERGAGQATAHGVAESDAAK